MYKKCDIMDKYIIRFLVIYLSPINQLVR